MQPDSSARLRQRNLPNALNIHRESQGDNHMPHDRMMQAIGRIEIGLGKLEILSLTRAVSESDSDLQARHERLKSETRAAISDIDRLIETLER
jgi:hypothetical protein